MCPNSVLITVSQHHAGIQTRKEEKDSKKKDLDVEKYIERTPSAMSFELARLVSQERERSEQKKVEFEAVRLSLACVSQPCPSPVPITPVSAAK